MYVTCRWLSPTASAGLTGFTDPSSDRGQCLGTKTCDDNALHCEPRLFLSFPSPPLAEPGLRGICHEGRAVE